MSAIRKGFEMIFPLSVMRILTWKEVEYKVCGSEDVEIERLKKITTYQGCSESDEYVERFWRVLETFSMEEKTAYLKFVWGRSRIPPEGTENIQKHTITYLWVSGERDPNIMLPISHTCFF